MKIKTLHVVAREGGWKLFSSSDESLSSGVFPNKPEAVQAGLKMLDEGVINWLTIHRRDGEIMCILPKNLDDRAEVEAAAAALPPATRKVLYLERVDPKIVERTRRIVRLDMAEQDMYD